MIDRSTVERLRERHWVGWDRDTARPTIRFDDGTYWDHGDWNLPAVDAHLFALLWWLDQEIGQ